MASQLIVNEDGSVTRNPPIILTEAVPQGAAGAAPGDVVVTSHDVTLSGVPARVFIPKFAAAAAAAADAGKAMNQKIRDKQKLPLLLYFHGGGFIFESAKSPVYHALCESLALKLQLVVLSVDYRLAPEHRLPAAYDDAFSVLMHLDSKGFSDLLEGYVDLGVDLSCCFFGGDSAGGNIAYFVGAVCRRDKQPLTKLKLAGVLLIQPFFGGVSRAESELEFDGGVATVLDMCWVNALPSGSDRDHPFCNQAKALLEGYSCDLQMQLKEDEEFPDTLFVIGGRDFLRSRQVEVVQLLRQAGKPVFVSDFSSSAHGFYILLPPSHEDVSQLFKVLASFVKERASSK